MNKFVLKNTFIKIYMHHFLINIFISTIMEDLNDTWSTHQIVPRWEFLTTMYPEKYTQKSYTIKIKS